MQKKLPRTDFGDLLALSWQTYVKGLGASFPVALLCGALPVFVVLAAVYFGLASALEPAMRVLKAVLLSLLENGFDEWALGAAMEQVQGSLGGLNPMEIILRALGSFGVTALVLIVLFPVLLACRLILTPISRGAALQAQLCALRGEKPRFSQAFSAIKRRMGSLMALELLALPPTAVVIAATVFLANAAGDLPVVGGVLVLAAGLAALTTITCVRHLAALRVIRDGVRTVDAFSQAVKRFFTDWTHLASGSLFFAGLFFGAVLIFAADVLLMVLAMLPPVAVLLFVSLFAPLFQALCTVMDAEQTRRASNQPPQAV